MIWTCRTGCTCALRASGGEPTAHQRRHLVGRCPAQGAYELNTIVAVGDRDRGVVPPCGRCRQVLLDYFPALLVIVGDCDRLRAVPITDLLPESYVWADHQLER